MLPSVQVGRWALVLGPMAGIYWCQTVLEGPVEGEGRGGLKKREVWRGGGKEEEGDEQKVVVNALSTTGYIIL